MNRFIRSLAAAGALFLGALTSGEALAQSVDPALAGHWQVTGNNGITASVVLDETAKITGTLSGRSPTGVNLNGCAFFGWVPADRVNVSVPTRFLGEATGEMIGCADRSVSMSYRVVVDVSPGVMVLGFVTADRGRLLFVVDGLTRVSGALAAAAPSEILDSRLLGHWQGSAGSVNAALDLTRIGGVSGTVTGPGLSGCKFSGSVPPRGAFENAEGAFAGIGSAKMTACGDAARNKTYAVILGATPESLSLAFIDIVDESELFLVEGMTRSGALAVTTTSRGGTAGMWYVPNESGWGLSLTLGVTAARIPFVVLYVYSPSTPTWYVMPSGTWTADARFEGDLYVTTGSDWRTSTFTPGTVVKVGRLSMTFTSDSAATLEYTITDSTGTRTVSKAMQKQPF